MPSKYQHQIPSGHDLLTSSGSTDVMAFYGGQSVYDQWMSLAIREIYETYGHVVKIGRKSLHKYGRYDSVGTSLVDLNYGGYDLVHSSTNSIDKISSSSTSDTAVSVTIEGMTISNGIYTFASQTASLNGQNKVTLTTPIATCTRIRPSGTTAVVGNVFAYEDGTISGGVPTDTSTIGNVLEAIGQSTFASGSSIAGNNYFIMTKWYAYMNKKTDAQADVYLTWRDVGGVYITREVRGITRSQPIDSIFQPYQIVKPNSDFDISALASTTGVDITAGVYGVFADIQ